MTRENKLEVEGVRETEVLNTSKPGILVLASGGGTNFQEIINKVESGELGAQIVGLISDNPKAYALERARNHNISEKLVSSVGRSKKNSPERAEFENELLEEIKKNNPNVIVLAGWMKVLSDEFLMQVQELNIPILNLHPALLTEGEEVYVGSSAGLIPVIRGAHAIKEAYDRKLPVSGVTVHQVIPGPFDTGPIILKREVSRFTNDTLEEWEARIHEMEYQILPEAISLVISKMEGNNA